MKKNFIWIVIIILIIILAFVVYKMNNPISNRRYDVKSTKNLNLDSISYSIDSTTGKVYRKSIFISDNLYILTVERTNDDNNLEVKEYAVSQKEWKKLNDIINKYDIAEMSQSRITNSNGEIIKNLDISYTDKKKEKIGYLISSNMELSDNDKNIFDEIDNYLNELEKDDKNINAENRDNY